MYSLYLKLAIFSFVYPILGVHLIHIKKYKIGIFMSWLLLLCGTYTLINAIYYLTVPDLVRDYESGLSGKVYFFWFIADIWEYIGIAWGTLMIFAAVGHLKYPER